MVAQRVRAIIEPYVLVPRPIDLIVMAPRPGEPEDPSLFDELRLLRATLLYADSVGLASLDFWAWTSGMYSPPGRPRPYEDPIRPATPTAYSQRASIDVMRRIRAYASDTWLYMPVEGMSQQEQAVAEAAFDDLCRAWDSGVLAARGPHFAKHEMKDRSLGKPPRPEPIIAMPDKALDYLLRRYEPKPNDSLWEGVLAAELLGQLECFPDASIDVILDVRSRLEGSRIGFRGAIAEASHELRDAVRSGEATSRALDDIRTRVVDPALQEIREELDALGVRRTLLRLASDRVTLASAAAEISVAAGAHGALGALTRVAEGTLSTPIIAAAAREASYREDLRSNLRLRPYWLLHEANRLLRRSGR